MSNIFDGQNGFYRHMFDPLQKRGESPFCTVDYPSGVVLPPNIANDCHFPKVEQQPRNPRPDDDETQGFKLNSTWINTATAGVFLCLSSSEGDAKWQLVSEMNAFDRYVVGLNYDGYFEFYDTIQAAINDDMFDIFIGGFFNQNVESFPIVVEPGRYCQIVANPYLGASISNGWGGANAHVLHLQNSYFMMDGVRLSQSAKDFSAVRAEMSGTYSNVVYLSIPIRPSMNTLSHYFWASPPSAPTIHVTCPDAASVEMRLYGYLFNSYSERVIKFDTNHGYLIMKDCDLFAGKSSSYTQKFLEFRGAYAFLDRCSSDGSGSSAFQEIVELIEGDVDVHNMFLNQTRQNSFHITGSDTTLNLYNVVIPDSSGKINDILVDPALTGVNISTQGCRLNHQKLTLNLATAVGDLSSSAPGNEQVVTLGRNYEPANLANWNNVDPVTIKAALDRLAALVGPVP
jgi:hypothetical protein